MGNSFKDSEEQPLLARSTRPSEPTSDSASSANDDDNEEIITSREDLNGDLGSKIDIWKAEKDGDGYSVPVHFWFACVAFPLFAGSFGPMSTAFGICAMTEPWRFDNVNTIYIIDPTWLDVLSALALALSMIANLSLLLAMANRLPYIISQLITVPSFFISAVIHIVSVILTNNLLLTSQHQSLTAPFYYACISAGISLLISLLLMYTFYLAKFRHETPPDLSETLTLPQRTLMAQSLGFITFLVAGAAIFSLIEDWKFTDSIYWATVTVLTIGYGDVTPHTHLGKSLIIFYATAGIVLIGLVVGSIATLVLDRGAKKILARSIVNARTEKLRAISPKASGEGLTRTSSHRLRMHLANEKAEFDLMRDVQANVALSQQWLLFYISVAAISTLWFVGAYVFWSTEKATQHWSYFDAVYFCFISLLTIGYGDFGVSSPAGKASFVFWAFLAVPTITILIASAGATFWVAMKAIIHSIDAFILLPHEITSQHSYLNKLLNYSKLKVKAKFGHRLGWSEFEDGHERHWHPELGEGVRNPDTGVIHYDHRLTHQKLPHDEQMTRQDLLYQLAREIRELLPKLSDSMGKKYTYEEWTKYIHLLNYDASKDGHLATASWSWLDNSSPLFRGKNETEWILERLSLRLEEELKRSLNSSDQGKGVAKPQSSRCGD